MADFFYWNKSGRDEGFNHLSVYLKNPSNNRPGWYFAHSGTYRVTKTDRAGTSYRQMPVRFGIHHESAQPDEAHKATKMGDPGQYLAERRGGGGYQILTQHEFGLRFSANSSKLPGQKEADASITIQTGPTGTAPTSPPPSMGGY